MVDGGVQLQTLDCSLLRRRSLNDEYCWNSLIVNKIATEISQTGQFKVLGWVGALLRMITVPYYTSDDGDRPIAISDVVQEISRD